MDFYWIFIWRPNHARLSLFSPQTTRQPLHYHYFRLKRPQECHKILLLILSEFCLQDHVEEFNCVIQSQQPPIVEVRRRILDAAQGESLDRTIGTCHHPVDHTRITHFAFPKNNSCPRISDSEDLLASSFPNMLSFGAGGKSRSSWNSAMK